MATISVRTAAILAVATASMLAGFLAFNATNGDGAGEENAAHQFQQNDKQSPYAGQEIMEIKSLSDKDIASLQNGTGEAFGGIAKLAELNGYPGPRHVLDMSSEIGLTPQQKVEIERIYQDMNEGAKALGLEIISAERQIDDMFANKTMTHDDLGMLLDKSGGYYTQLRYAHLSAHLKTTDVLTAGQVHMYNELRGYHQAHG